MSDHAHDHAHGDATVVALGAVTAGGTRFAVDREGEPEAGAACTFGVERVDGGGATPTEAWIVDPRGDVISDETVGEGSQRARSPNGSRRRRGCASIVCGPRPSRICWTILAPTGWLPNRHDEHWHFAITPYAGYIPSAFVLRAAAEDSAGCCYGSLMGAVEESAPLALATGAAPRRGGILAAGLTRDGEDVGAPRRNEPGRSTPPLRSSRSPGLSGPRRLSGLRRLKRSTQT